MKKIYHFTLAAAAMVCAAMSCTQETPETPTQTPVETPAAVTWRFCANVESPVTKMAYDATERAFAWEDNDEVRILWADGSTTATAALNAGRAEFTPAGTLPSEGTEVWLVYPSDMAASLNSGKLEVDMPAILDCPDYFVAKALVGDATVDFNHPFCYYKFTVDGDGSDVSRLELASAGDDDIAAASVSIAIDGSGKPEVAGKTGAAKVMTVDFAAPGTWYVPFLPVSIDPGNLSFQFYRSDARTEKAGAYRHNGGLVNARATIVNWEDLPAKVTNRYVSTSASGSANGTTPDKAWSLAQFKAFMEATDGRDTATKALFDGINIRFAAGTYTPSAKIAPNIAIATNLIGEDAATTIFDGNGSMIIFDIWKVSGETVTFKNFTFRNATNSGNHGGVVRIGNSDREFNVSFENCIFSNNSAGSGKCGGVFSVTGANSSLSVKDCAFNNNTAGSCGGAIHAETSAVVSFDNCSFTSNSAVAGGALDIQGTAGVTCKDCVFTTNSATKYGGSATHKDVGAGAIILRKSGDAITLTGCTFNENTATGMGGVIASISTNTVINADGCLFSGNNSGSGWGSVIHLSGYAGQRIYLNDCIIKDNTNTSRGAIAFHNSATSLIYMNDVTFKDNVNSGSNAWGVAAHGGASVVCMNNVTAMGNHSTNANPGNSCVFNSNGGWLIVNSTVIDGTPTALVRSGTIKTTVCNNILVNNSTANNVFAITGGDSYFQDCGHNVLSCDGTYNNAEPAASDLLGRSESFLAGSYTEPLYIWSGTLSGFQAATRADVENAVKGYDVDYSEYVSGVTHVGNDFYNWLSGIGAIGKDARGVSRSGSWWPGAYQN